MKVIIDYEIPPTRAVRRYFYDVPPRITDWWEAAAQAGAQLQMSHDIGVRVLTVTLQREESRNDALAREEGE